MSRPFHIAGALLLLLCSHAPPLAAQNVYRCGGSYSNEPCPGAKLVPTEDTRSAAQRAQTDAATRRDAQSAQAMEKERLKQEGVPAQATIPLAAPEALAPLPEPVAARTKARKPDLFTAASPRKAGDAKGKKKKKTKAKKAAA